MTYSPLLAAVTGIFELAAAALALFSPGRKRILYPTALMLLLLAGYQFMEIAVCSTPNNLLFARAAYIEITWLPPLGLWLVFVLSGPKLRWMKIVSLAYFAAGLVFTAWIVLDAGCITKSFCELVIARYFSPNPFDPAYGIFYQTGLAMLILGAAAGLAHTEDLVLRKHLANLQTGVLGFAIPSLAVRMMIPDTQGVLPSVMCHFALILAVSLCFLVFRERRTGVGAS